MMSDRISDLEAEVARLTAENKSLDALAQGERAVADTASGIIAELRAKLSECAAMGLECCRRLTERDAEVVTLTEQRDRARYELRRTSATWQCVECDAVPSSSTWFGSRNKVFVIGRLVHKDGCGVASALGEVT